MRALSGSEFRPLIRDRIPPILHLGHILWPFFLLSYQELTLPKDTNIIAQLPIAQLEKANTQLPVAQLPKYNSSLPSIEDIGRDLSDPTEDIE